MFGKNFNLWSQSFSRNDKKIHVPLLDGVGEKLFSPAVHSGIQGFHFIFKYLKSIKVINWKLVAKATILQFDWNIKQTNKK